VGQNAPVVIIGAGPYGLSVAAHLNARGITPLVLGKPMEFWQPMPKGMYLKSIWSASSLSDPAHRYSLSRYTPARQMSRREPIPLTLFVDYGLWFQQHAVPDIDHTYVRTLSRDGKGFHLDLEDGRTVKARHVIVATGISSFAFIPEFARNLPPTYASHSQAELDFSHFRDRRVVVVGSGQSGLESAALLHEAGAHVELIVRGSIIWISRTLYYRTGPARHLFYPPSDVGPPGINWLTAFPLVLRRLPARTQGVVARRAVRPAGAQWLRPRVEGRIRTTTNTRILSAIPQESGIRLALDDGSTREADYLLLGTGYQPDLHRLSYLDPTLRDTVEQQQGLPIENEWLESSVPHLYFVGALAQQSFGPICRFVAGAKVAGEQIAHHVARVH
jgi:thioredoxin reductase